MPKSGPVSPLPAEHPVMITQKNLANRGRELRSCRWKAEHLASIPKTKKYGTHVRRRMRNRGKDTEKRDRSNLKSTRDVGGCIKMTILKMGNILSISLKCSFFSMIALGIIKIANTTKIETSISKALSHLASQMGQQKPEHIGIIAILLTQEFTVVNGILMKRK